MLVSLSLSWLHTADSLFLSCTFLCAPIAAGIHSVHSHMISRCVAVKQTPSQFFFLFIPPVPCFSNFTAPMGTVLSPDYPEGYGNNLNCVWLIISEPGTRIHLAFNDFDLEPPYDFLTIKDGDQSGSTLMGRFSGAEVPSHLTSNSNVLQLEFQADHSMSGRGFNITYSSKNQLNVLIVVLL